MEATMQSSASSRVIRVLRFLAAFVLTPLVMMIWLGVSVDTVLTYFGANPEGPARVILGAMIVMIGFGVPSAALVFFGLPYVLFMLSHNRLTFLAILVPTCPVALAYSLLVYSTMQPARNPALALALATATLPGVLAAGLFFYLVGVWRNAGSQPFGS
jgi:hypothetical protein